jgi:hypothetical protein
MADTGESGRQVVRAIVYLLVIAALVVFFVGWATVEAARSGV